MFYRYDTWVKTAQGPALAGVYVYVCNQPANTSVAPPSPLAATYSDPNGLFPLAQPLQTDGFGHAAFYIAPGTYTVVITIGNNIQNVYPDQSIGLAGQQTTFQTNGVANSNQGLLNLVGSGNVNIVYNPTTGQTFVNSTGTVVPPTGSGPLLVSAFASFSAAPSGDVVTTDGLGNAKDSGTLLSSLVTSVFGRTGAVVAQNGDYTATQVGALATSLMTTAGDMIYENATPTAARLPIGTVGQVLTVAGGLPTWVTPAAAGTVTSVSFTGGLISVATPTTTPAFTVAGTSGGVVYFNSATTWASSAVLPAGDVMLGGGAGAAPNTSAQLTFVAPKLTVGLAGGSSGILALTGSVSGSATFTAPAVAGTVTNPISISNSLQLPSGTVYGINGDTGLSRVSAGVVAVGNGTAGDESGTLSSSALISNANNASAQVVIAGLVGNVATLGAIYIAQTTPSATNYALIASATQTYLNAATEVNLQVAGTTNIVVITSTGVAITGALSISGAVTEVGSQASVGSLGVPVVVYATLTTNRTAAVANATVFTTTAAGRYRISATIIATTLSSSAWVLGVAATVTQTGQAGAIALFVSPEFSVGTSYSVNANTGNAQEVNLASGATIGIAVSAVSGSNTGGVYSYDVVIERLT